MLKRTRNITDSVELYKLVNQDTMRGWEKDIWEYNAYWKFFRDAEMKEPMEFYTYFYEDMVLERYESVKKLVEFIGFYNLKGVSVGDEDINEILRRIDGDTLVKKGRDINLRKGKICGFWDELSRKNAKKSDGIVGNLLLPELIEKFNKTCKFDVGSLEDRKISHLDAIAMDKEIVGEMRNEDVDHVVNLIEASDKEIWFIFGFVLMACIIWGRCNYYCVYGT